MNKLTGKQQAFKYYYARNGQNGVQAAKEAGYKGNDNTLAQRAFELVRNSKTKKAIDEEIAALKAEKVASREERQRFWTRVMQGMGLLTNMADRLRASELLGKSEADFTENVLTKDLSAQPDFTPEQIERLRKQAKELTKPNITLRTG